MAERRVAITGLGVLGAAGIGVEPFWEALRAGRSAVGAVEAFDAGEFECAVGGEVRDFKVRDHVPKSYRKATKVMARDIELAVAAADMAFRDAGIVTRADPERDMAIDPKRLGCNVGAGLICSDLDELGMAVNTATVDGRFDLKAWGETGLMNLTPLWLLKYLPNMLSCHVTIIHGCEGPSNCITCGDASGHMAVGESARYVLRGAADVVVAGGAESKLNPMGLLRQQLLGRLNTQSNASPDLACRPFDRDHGGTVVGEGGGLLILEDLDRATARGATVYAEVAGFGSACDPAGIEVERRNVGALDLALRRALRDARVAPDDVDLLVTHGTGVPEEDALEAAAWARAIGPRTPDVPACAVTGCLGSLFAGAGGVELVAAALALHHQTTPATAGFERAAEGCELNLAAEARPGRLTYALSGAFGVGGQSAAILLKRYEP